MDKYTIVYPDNDLLLSNKKEQVIDICNNLDESQRHYAEWKKRVQKVTRLSLYDILENTIL